MNKNKECLKMIFFDKVELLLDTILESELI